MSKQLYNYTDGESFTLNGNSYTGYYNITNNTIYTGREVTQQSQVLNAKGNLPGSYYTQIYYTDRTYNTVLTLPYQTITFSNGEYINSNSINNNLNKLFSNFLQLFNYCFFNTDLLPENYTGYISVSGEGETFLSFNTNTEVAFDSLSSINLSLTGLQNFTIIPSGLSATNQVPQNVFVFLNTLSSFYVYNSPFTPGDSLSFTMSSSTIDLLNEQQFSDITSVVYNNKDSIFVGDKNNNQIYKIYVAQIVNDSRIDPTKMVYLTTTGNNLLSGISFLNYYNDELYVYNDLSKKIVVLDKDLSFRRDYVNKFFVLKNVASMAVNTVTDEIFILLDDFSILRVDKEFKTGYTTLDLPITFANETAKKILFSKNNSNIFYIVTSRNVYKFLLNNNSYVGNFKWYLTNIAELSTSMYEIRDSEILQTEENVDNLFILSKNILNTGYDRILFFKENNKAIPALEDSDIDIFTFDDIKLKEEYFNNLTYNKAIKKLLYNHDLLISYIQTRFAFRYNDQKDLLFKGREVLSLPEKNSLIVPKNYNYFVGVNEVLTPQVLNRTVNEIIKLQLSIIGILQKNVVNTKYSSDEVVTF